MDEPTRIFVYGTLKKKHGNHGVLGNSTFLGEAVTNSKEFTMYDGGFPFVSDYPNDPDNAGSIVGELYETDNKSILANLDRLEGVPSLYVKREVDVTTLDGISYIATIYVASRGSNDRLKTRTPMIPKGRSKLLEWK
jgi:gamma-glutamylcyclotransferase (GGCT)/AIG2-like uncharacterized protein YtfP